MSQPTPPEPTNDHTSEPELTENGSLGQEIDIDSFVKHRGILLPSSAVPRHVRVLRLLPRRINSIPTLLYGWSEEINYALNSAFDWLWSGLKDKTLVVPVVIALSTLSFQQSTKERDLEIADTRAKQETLNRYFDQISTLLFEQKLRAAKNEDEARIVARARTLTALRELNGESESDKERKGQLIRFLHEANLIQGERPIINLADANLGTNLSGIDLSKANLKGTNLSGVDLSKANLEGTNLSGVDLGGVNLFEASLKGAVLSNTALDSATLCKTVMPNGTTSDRDCATLNQE